MSNQSAQKIAVKLSLFYGVATYDVKGNVTSKNEKVTLIQDSSEWENFMKHLKSNGITEAKVISAYDLNKVKKDRAADDTENYEPIKDLSKIQAEVDKFYKAPEKPLTAELQMIKDLQDKVEALTKGKETPENEALKNAREEYETLAGKKGAASWTLEQVNEKIAELKKEQK
jgi:hypothetical protein